MPLPSLVFAPFKLRWFYWACFKHFKNIRVCAVSNSNTQTFYILLHCRLLIEKIRTLILHGKRKPDRLKKKPMTRVWCGNRDLPSRYTGTRLRDNRQPVRIIIRPLRSLFHNHDQDATTDLPRKFETEEFSPTGIWEGSQILKESIDVFRSPLRYPKPKAKYAVYH